jgi:hypothetical protein
LSGGGLDKAGYQNSSAVFFLSGSWKLQGLNKSLGIAGFLNLLLDGCSYQKGEDAECENISVDAYY